MRRPLLVATATSFFLHSAVVFALVSMPALAPAPERDPATTTEVSLAPQFTSASDQPPPAPVFLREAKPAEQVAKEVPEPVAPSEAIEKNEQIASLPEAAPPTALSPALPDVKLAAPVEPLKPAETTTIREASPAPASQQQIASDSVAAAGAPAENARDRTPAESPAETRTAETPKAAEPDAAATTSAENLTGGEIKPGEIAQAGPASPLFPSDPLALASSAPPADTLSLPVIASDDTGASSPEAGAQAVNPNELPSVSDTGPGGEANAAGAGAASRAKTLTPPAAKRPASEQGARGLRSTDGKSGDGRGGGGPIYDPAVRSRYSTNLFTYLRRSLVFPSSGTTGTTTVRFILDRNGRILQSGVVGSSGSPELDSQALSIVQRAAPYPRFPEGFGSSQLEVTLPVTFK